MLALGVPKNVLQQGKKNGMKCGRKQGFSSSSGVTTLQKQVVSLNENGLYRDERMKIYEAVGKGTIQPTV